MPLTKHPIIPRKPAISNNTLVRRVVLPIVLLFGLYGLFRYAVTGEGGRTTPVPVERVEAEAK